MIRNSLICKLINVQASIKENNEKKIKKEEADSRLWKKIADENGGKSNFPKNSLFTFTILVGSLVQKREKKREKRYRIKTNNQEELIRKQNESDATSWWIEFQKTSLWWKPKVGDKFNLNRRT